MIILRKIFSWWSKKLNLKKLIIIFPLWNYDSNKKKKLNNIKNKIKRNY